MGEQVFEKSPHPSLGPGEIILFIAQGAAIVFFMIFVEFDALVEPHSFDNRENRADDISSEAWATVEKDSVQNLYPAFQDVHVMIFIGFAYLMTFIKANSLTALAFNWIISVWALQWAIIWSGLWGNWIHGGSNIQLNLAKMIVADFGAGTVMITYGAVLGKCTLV